MESKLYYFAYGSNLLSCRISLSVPNAKLKCIGLLKDYEIVFSGNSKSWHGSSANVRKNLNSKEVYGAVYEVTEKNLLELDKQEGVAIKIYQRFLVEIINIADNSIVQCYTYDKFNKNETNGKPSPAYKNVIINGAKEVGLPENYIQYLRSFEDNGYKGAINVDIPMEFILSS